MPIIKSAKKRVRVAKKATALNVRTKRKVKSAVKTLASKPTSLNLAKAQSAIDSAVKKGILHKNKGARKKAQLYALAKEAGVKLSTKKPPAKKSPAKKPAVKKVAAKKPAPKKLATKKTAKK